MTSIRSIMIGSVLIAPALAVTGCGSSGGTATKTVTNASAASAGTYGPGPKTGPGPGTINHLRNVRYCEIIPVTRDQNVNTATIYNTINLNTCPANKWSAITEDAVDKAYGSQQAKLNGPRYWVLDSLQGAGSSSSGETWVFNGIEMAKRGQVQTKLRDSTVGSSFYTVNTVNRDTVWIYDKGTKVYELTGPDGSIYTMQSYSQIKDKSLTIGDLDHLGSKLSLPKGWKYSVRTLSQKMELKANGTAYVVNDDYYDSYQRRVKGTGSSS